MYAYFFNNWKATNDPDFEEKPLCSKQHQPLRFCETEKFQNYLSHLRMGSIVPHLMTHSTH